MEGIPMKTSSPLLLLTACLTLAGGNAYADQVLIKYRSGNTQTFELIRNPAGYHHNVVQNVGIVVA